MAFANYLDMFPNLTDSFQLIKDRTTYEQPLPIPINLSVQILTDHYCMHLHT